VEGEPGSIIGYVAVTGEHIVSISHCPIAHPRFQPILEALQEAGEDATHIEGEIELRTGYPAVHTQVLLGPGTESLATPLLQRLQARDLDAEVSIQWMEDRKPRSTAGDRGNPIRLRTEWATWTLPPRVFYQVYPEIAIDLARELREWASLTARDRAVDLFGGIGFLAAAFAGQAMRVWVLEGHLGSVRAGERAIQREGIGNVRFVPGPVERLLPTMNFKGTLSLAVLDPPREGAPRPVIEHLLRVMPSRIIYVSCDAGTLARDVKRLIDGGYRHVRSAPYDFFPQTYHFESLTLLEKRVDGET